MNRKLTVVCLSFCSALAAMQALAGSTYAQFDSYERFEPIPEDGAAGHLIPTPHATPAPGTPMVMPNRAVFSESISPPPGTIGQTYQRPSSLIPKDEHPRTAMIDIYVKGYKDVEVVGLEDFTGFQGTDGVWHFKSKTPLLPHLPHIYQVFASNGPKDEAVRTVRMIPGRIVTLTY